MTTETQARPLFAAHLTPHRSLSPRGIRIVVGVFIGMLVVPALVFIALGVWIVLGFMAASVVALYAALRWSFRDGRRFEDVTLWADRLEIRQVSPRGALHEESFTPFAVRLRVERDFDERVTAIILREREHELAVGAFLNPDDKASFAQAFGTALRKARG